MAYVRLQKQWQIVQGSGWSFGIRFWKDPARTLPDDISTCSVEVTLLKPGSPVAGAIVFLSTDGTPWVFVSGNAIVGAVPLTPTLTWAVGIYDVKFRVIDPLLTVDRYVVFGAGKLTVQADQS